MGGSDPDRPRGGSWAEQPPAGHTQKGVPTLQVRRTQEAEGLERKAQVEPMVACPWGPKSGHWGRGRTSLKKKGLAGQGPSLQTCEPEEQGTLWPREEHSGRVGADSPKVSSGVVRSREPGRIPRELG